MKAVAAALGIAVITVLMACAVVGAIASLRKREEGLGAEFLNGLRAIGDIFIPVAGIMAAIPYLSRLVRFLFARVYEALGADPSVAATTFLAVDMGGYQLARTLAGTAESWVMATFTGMMAGATIVFSIPVGLSMLSKRDHPYMALGVMAGLLAIPAGVFIASVVALLLRPEVKDLGGEPVALQLTLLTIVSNLVPLVIVVAALAAGLRLVPGLMIRGFMAFGRGLTAVIRLVLVAAIVQYFTEVFYGRGLFTLLFGGWGFDPVIVHVGQINARADLIAEGKAEGVPEEMVVRALEVAGYIGLMLSGAFPLVYLMQTYLRRPMVRLGGLVGLSAEGAAGVLAAAANILAMFHLIGRMPPRDKVLCIAFAVCAAFTFGDHLAFTSNFQPNLLLPVLLGKLGGGAVGFLIAARISAPRAAQLERDELRATLTATLPDADTLGSTSKEALARTIIDRLGGDGATVVELGGGLTNPNFRLDWGGARYVLRIALPGTELLGIDRVVEAACSRAAAAAGVGPEFLWYLPDRATLVSRFVPGRPLSNQDLRDPKTLARVAATVRRCHNHPLPSGLAPFRPFDVVRAYVARAREYGVPLPATLDVALVRLGRIERDVLTGEPAVLCHNDLLPANFLDTGDRLVMIDWEYGGAGDRYFDLGNFAVNTGLSEAQEAEFLAHYLGILPTVDQLRRLRLMRLVSDMREATWSFLQAGISRLGTPEAYLARGVDHLNRFLDAARKLGPD